MKFRTYILSLLAFSMAIWLLYHLACIWIYGNFFIYEPNSMILVLETVFITLCLLFSISCIVEQLKANYSSKWIRSESSDEKIRLENIRRT